MQEVYRHRRLVVSDLVEDIMKRGDSKLTETIPTFLYEEKLSPPTISVATEVHLVGQAFSLLFISNYGWHII